MKYRVQLLRTVQQVGLLEIDANSQQEALDWAKQSADLTGVVVRTPTWTDEIRLGPVEVIDVSEAA